MNGLANAGAQIKAIDFAGGTVGMLFTGVFATPAINANLSTNLSGLLGHTLWHEQVKAMGLTLGLAVGGTLLVTSLVQATIGLRLSHEEEQIGLDQTDHGEHGYVHDSGHF